MDYCINKNTNEKIFAFDVENEYGIKDIGTERKLRLAGEREELICPECKTPVILRAGEIKIPHFAHKIKTKECFYSTYTYNENRQKALKILYNLLKKFEDIEILEVTKKFSENGVIDILIEVKSYYFGERTKHAILLKNTSDSYEKWEGFKNELLMNDITPIYFNYGTSKELKNFKEKLDNHFFYRNLIQLTGNKGIRFINTENCSFNSIIAKMYIDDKNVIKGYEYQVQEVKYKDFIDIFFNQTYTMKYIFDFDCKKEIENLDKVIGYDHKYNSCNEGFTPFFLVSDLGYIFLVVAINETSYSYNEELNPLEFEVIDFNFFLSNPRFYYNYIYYYPYYELLKDSNYLELNNEEDKDELQEFLEDKSDLGKFKIISLENMGIMKKYLYEFIEVIEKQTEKLYTFDYIDKIIEDNLYKYKDVLNNLNRKDLNNILKNKEILNKICYGSYIVEFPKKYLKPILECLEKNINLGKKEEYLFNLFNLFKELEYLEKKDIKLILEYETIEKIKLLRFFSKIFGNHYIFGRFFDSEKNINIEKYYTKYIQCLKSLSAYNRIKDILNPSKESKELGKFIDCLNSYFIRNNFQSFKKFINKEIEKQNLEDCFIKSFKIILEKKSYEIIRLFLENAFDVTKSIRVPLKNELDLSLGNTSYTSKNTMTYPNLIDLLKENYDLQLLKLFFEYGYREILSAEIISNILCKNFEENPNQVKEVIKNDINLNKKAENSGATIFFHICRKTNNLDLISYCINLGANLNIKTNNKNTPLKILKDKINKGIIDKTQVEKYLAEIIEVIR